jgi:hypothetical protein
MHQLYGTNAGHICGECCNFFEHRYDKKYFKCSVYGDSSSEATDWRKSYVACGHFGRKANSYLRPTKVYVKPEPVIEILEGQISIFDGEE